MKSGPSDLSRRKFIALFATGTYASTVVTAPRLSNAAVSSEPRSGADATQSPLAVGQNVSKVYQTLSLDGAWTVSALALDIEGTEGYRLLKSGRHESLPAQVPGEVHLDLMRIGRMKDPDFSDNARTQCRWPEKYSWWYVKEFVVPAGFRTCLRQRLVFEGVDLDGQIFVNGQLAGTTKDALSGFEIEVAHLLKDGANELVVRVTSGMELPPTATLPPTAAAVEHFKSLDPVYAVREIEVIQGSQRKARCTYGTDFCDPMPNIGIWRSVRLEGRTQVIIHHLRLDTLLHGEDVSLDGELIVENLHPWSEIPAVLELKVVPPQGEPIVRTWSINAQMGRFAIPCHIVIPSPQLWWPNGMGDQPLYQVNARIVCSDEETDARSQMIGLRVVELDRTPLPEGSRFCLKVNGQRVFCKGGNWVQTDLIPARTGVARYQKLVEEARNANCNMLRVNGDSLYESDVFYDACDRAGILVWQDFIFSDARYRDLDEAFIALIRNEVEGVVKRIRHHASLALWCGSNECQWAMQDVWKPNLTQPAEQGGTRIYNEILPDICRFYDPSRPYWPGSPAGGVTPNGVIAGDFHGLGNHGAGEHMTGRTWREVADASRARFVAESYVLGPPNMASIREYLRPDELSRRSTGWRIHTNEDEGGTTAAGIACHYGDPDGLSLEEFVLYGQMYQAIVNAGILEALRFRTNDPVDDCHGHLIWSYNDTWGEFGWSIIDHYLRRKASYYSFRRAAAPVKVLVRSRGDTLVTRVVNDTLNSYRATVHCGWIRVNGTASEMQNHVTTIPANGMVEIARAVIPPSTERSSTEWLYAATLTGDGIAADQAIWPLVPHRELALQKPVISTRVESGVLEVRSSVYCHGVHLEDGGREVLSDNYFDLLPGVLRRIPITRATASNRYVLEAVMPIGGIVTSRQ